MLLKLSKQNNLTRIMACLTIVFKIIKHICKSQMGEKTYVYIPIRKYVFPPIQNEFKNFK